MDQTLNATRIFRPFPPTGKRVLGSRAVCTSRQGTGVPREGPDISTSPVIRPAVVTNQEPGSQIERRQGGSLDRREEGQLESVREVLEDFYKYRRYEEERLASNFRETMSALCRSFSLSEYIWDPGTESVCLE